MRNVLLKKAAWWLVPALAAALALGFFSTEVAQAHYSTTTIYSYTNSVTTGHNNTSSLDEACGSTYRLSTRTQFDEVTDTEAQIDHSSLTTKIYSGQPTGGTYRLGNYNNQTMVIKYFMLNVELEDGVRYNTPRLDKEIPFAWNNQIVVTWYSYAGSGSACQNIDWDFFYPDD